MDSFTTNTNTMKPVRFTVRKPCAIRMYLGYKIEVFISRSHKGGFDARVRDKKGAVIETDTDTPFYSRIDALNKCVEWVHQCVIGRKEIQPDTDIPKSLNQPTMNNNTPKSGSGMIAVERAEQIIKHGRTFATDAKYYSKDVFTKAAVALLHMNINEWPQQMPQEIFLKIIAKETTERIAVAGAFLAAAIDYINVKRLIPKEGEETDMDAIDAITNEVIALGFAPPDNVHDVAGCVKIVSDYFIDNAFAKPFRIKRDNAYYELVLNPLPAFSDSFTNESSTQRPPLGLRPRHIAILERMEEIMDVMRRYQQVLKSIPQKWSEELSELYTIMGEIGMAHLVSKNITEQVYSFKYFMGHSTSPIAEASKRVISTDEMQANVRYGDQSVNRVAEHLEKTRDSAILKEWKDEQTALSETELQIPTKFLREKHLIADGFKIFLFVKDRGDKGMEHINLAALLQSYLKWTIAGKGSDSKEYRRR